MKAVVGDYSTDIHLTIEEAKVFCKPGRGADTCIWLVVSPDGWLCLFHNKPSYLLRRWDAGETIAKRDGCDKVRNLPWPPEGGIVIF